MNIHKGGAKSLARHPSWNEADEADQKIGERSNKGWDQ